MSGTISEYQDSLRRELVNFARSEIFKYQDVINRSCVVKISSNSINPACQQNSMAVMMRYSSKRELALAARVCKIWKDLAYNPDLWDRILRNDDQADMQFRLFAFNPLLRGCSKLYYDRMSVEAKIDNVEGKIRKYEEVKERTVDVLKFTAVMTGAVGVGLICASSNGDNPVF